MKMSNKTYDVLKYIALVGLDALGLLYKAVAGAWDLPFANEIVLTFSAISAFLGQVLQISNMNYKKDNADE